MGKLSKEELARFEGAAWALRMVEEKGLEAAQKDLEQRGIRRLPLACKKQDIREFEQYEKKNTLATVLMIASTKHFNAHSEAIIMQESVSVKVWAPESGTVSESESG